MTLAVDKVWDGRFSPDPVMHCTAALFWLRDMVWAAGTPLSLRTPFLQLFGGPALGARGSGIA